MSFDLYQTVTDQIVAMLETGVVPWRSPILGRNSAGHPKNHNSGKQYRSVNIFLLAFTAYARGLRVRHKPGGIGGLQQTIPAIALSSYNFTNAYLGRSAFVGDNSTSGSVDEFRIYNNAQSATAIAADAAAGPTVVLPVPEPISMSFLALGALGLLSRRPRRR